MNYQIHLEGVIKQVGDALGVYDCLNLEVVMERVWTCTWRA